MTQEYPLRLIHRFKKGSPVFIPENIRENLRASGQDNIFPIGWVSGDGRLGLRVDTELLKDERYREYPGFLPVSMRVRVYSYSQQNVIEIVLQGPIRDFTAIKVLGQSIDVMPKSTSQFHELMDAPLYRDIARNPLDHMFSLGFRSDKNVQPTAHLVSAKKIASYPVEVGLPESQAISYMLGLWMYGSLNTPNGWLEEIKADIEHYTDPNFSNPAAVKVLQEDKSALEKYLDSQTRGMQ